MAAHLQPRDPLQLAVDALDEFVAEIVRQARAAGLQVPPALFDWAADDGTRLVERLVRRRLQQLSPQPAAGLATALRCAVHYWAAPWVAARFASLRPLFPELQVSGEVGGMSVMVRTGRWRCAFSGAQCEWKLCDGGG